MDKGASALERLTGVTIPRNPNAPIKPGDTVYLLSGDHGVINLQGAFGRDLVGYANSNFITIEALQGQTPIVRQLKVLGGSKWVFRGLTFESVNDTGFQTAAGAGLFLINRATVDDGCAPFFIQCSMRSCFSFTDAGFSTG